MAPSNFQPWEGFNLKPPRHGRGALTKLRYAPMAPSNFQPWEGFNLKPPRLGRGALTKLRYAPLALNKSNSGKD
jgi:hypothetical protein